MKTKINQAWCWYLFDKPCFLTPLLMTVSLVINILLCELITDNQSFLVVFSFYSKDSRIQKGGVWHLWENTWFACKIHYNLFFVGTSTSKSCSQHFYQHLSASSVYISHLFNLCTESYRKKRWFCRELHAAGYSGVLADSCVAWRPEWQAYSLHKVSQLIYTANMSY